jgi:UTP--glucose-1-phosphate uridylyltransferase
MKKAVITAAGLGTRLLPTTKETPKEMLPVFIADGKGKIQLKPLLQIVFEQLYSFGIREFCFIVGRGKRSIEDHFTPDYSFLDSLKNSKKQERGAELDRFYTMLTNSDITWKNQWSPKGFGDAIALAENFVENDDFIVYAGDTFIISENNQCLTRLIHINNKYKGDLSLLCEKVSNPKRYGVIVGTKIEKGGYSIEKIIEKPKVPPTNLVSLAVYTFSPKIFDALEQIETNNTGELELTDAIQILIEEGNKAFAIELEKEEKRLDIGTVESYLRAIQQSYRYAQQFEKLGPAKNEGSHD